MSTSSHSFPKLPRGPDVLGELLHSLSQPLTGLRCSLELSLQNPLELSIEELAEQQQESVAAALQETEKVIGMIQLMREYLDAEQPGPEDCPAALAPAMLSVIEELSSIAAVRGVRLRLVGTCSATLPVPESRLRLALQYLITTMIDAQPAGGGVTLLLGEGPAGAVLRVEGERKVREAKVPEMDAREPEVREMESATSSHTNRNPDRATSRSVSTLRRVRLAIASRVLETAGASLVFDSAGHTRADPARAGPTRDDPARADPAGFVLRVPHRISPRVR